MNTTALRQLRNSLLQPHPEIQDLAPFFNPDQPQHLALVLEQELGFFTNLMSPTLQISPSPRVNARRLADQHGLSLSMQGFAALQDPYFTASLRSALSANSWLSLHAVYLRVLRRQIPAAARKALKLTGAEAAALFDWTQWDIDLGVWWTKSKPMTLRQRAEIASEAVNRFIAKEEGHYDPNQAFRWAPSWASEGQLIYS